MKPRDASPRDLREGNKRPLNKKQEGPEEKKYISSQEDRGSHHEPTYYVHGYLAV